MPELVGAIDEGTSSARFILFEAGTANVVCYHQIEIPQITPQEGWVEQDPQLILEVVERCIEITIEKLIKMNGDPKVFFCYLGRQNSICIAMKFIYRI